MPPPPYRVLFVCMGNICRSPAGDNVFRHLVAESGLSGRIACDSAGTIDYHTGKAPDPRMAGVLASRGFPVQGAARQVCQDDLDRFDLILTMDEENRRDVLDLAANETHRGKIRRFSEFCTRSNHLEIPDPYYDGEGGFESVADMIEDGCAGLLEYVRRQLP